MADNADSISLVYELRNATLLRPLFIERFDLNFNNVVFLITSENY